MVNKLIFYFLLVLIHISVYSQKIVDEKQIKFADSLQKIEKLEDSELIWQQLIKNGQDKNRIYYTARSNFVKGLIDGHQNGNYDEAILKFNLAEKYFLKCKQTKKIQKWISNTYLEASYCYWNWDEALRFNKKGYEYTLKNLPEDKNIISFLTDQGEIYRRLDNEEQSIVSLEGALKKIIQLTPDDYEQLGYVHNLLGIAYSDLHFHSQSLYHYDKELEFHIKSNTSDKAYVVNAMNNVIWENIGYGDEKKAKSKLASLNKNFYKWYRNKNFATTNAGSLKDYNLYFKAIFYLSNLRISLLDKKNDEAKKYLDSIAEVFDKYPEKRKRIDNTQLLSRFAYAKKFEITTKENKSDALEHITFVKKTLEIAQFREAKHDELVASLQLANAYYNYENYTAALKVVEEAKLIDKSFFNASLFSIEVLEAKILNSLGKSDQSKYVLLNSYRKLLVKQSKLKNLKNLHYSDLKKFNSSTFIKNIIQSAQVYEDIYQKTKNKEDLLIANNLYFLVSDMFAEFYQKGRYNYSLNVFNQEIGAGLLQTQLLIDPNDQKKLKDIINRIENNSSQHLWNIFEVKNNQNLKVPKALIRKLNELVFEKNSVEEQIEKEKQTVALKNLLVFLNKEIAKAQNEIAKKDPSFQKFKSADFSIEETQKKLDNKHLVIKYVVTNKKVFTFSIQKNSIQLIDLGKAALLKRAVNDYNTQIKTIDPAFQKASKNLYGKLVQPLLINKSISSIIFIPEDFLTTVSFESLQDKKGELLVQNFKTSYAYSIKLWNILQEKNHATNQNESIVTFAPNYSKLPPKNETRGLLRADLYDLADAKKEARAISQLFNGKRYENQEANRDNFLQSTTNYSLHHLAMHSQLEDDYSKSALVFAGNKRVYFDELYQLNFPSKLVVLSACNTGIGTNENGEGLMSLSRALTYSGVKSSVYSLWQVPDKETSEIMISFYENLKKGQAKDEALANAKTTFIEMNPMKKHPFYWAGFVLNGDVSPIISSSNWMIYVGIGLGILILLIAFRKKLFNFRQ